MRGMPVPSGPILNCNCTDCERMREEQAEEQQSKEAILAAREPLTPAEVREFTDG